ncbi:hypothetical protein [Parashewanella tropica]|uniref:hypothetical protein n=1 Tax=Parashewanella tropica TaxID=2547970 RepID=UPI001059395E|nr:hypothetical protein [Parashewanella tropica]
MAVYQTDPNPSSSDSVFSDESSPNNDKYHQEVSAQTQYTNDTPKPLGTDAIHDMPREYELNPLTFSEVQESQLQFFGLEYARYIEGRINEGSLVKLEFECGTTLIGGHRQNTTLKTFRFTKLDDESHQTVSIIQFLCIHRTTENRYSRAVECAYREFKSPVTNPLPYQTTLDKTEKTIPNLKTGYFTFDKLLEDIAQEELPKKPVFILEGDAFLYKETVSDTSNRKATHYILRHEPELLFTRLNSLSSAARFILISDSGSMLSDQLFQSKREKCLPHITCEVSKGQLSELEQHLFKSSEPESVYVIGLDTFTIEQINHQCQSQQVEVKGNFQLLTHLAEKHKWLAVNNGFPSVEALYHQHPELHESLQLFNRSRDKVFECYKPKDESNT